MPSTALRVLAWATAAILAAGEVAVWTLPRGPGLSSTIGAVELLAGLGAIAVLWLLRRPLGPVATGCGLAWAAALSVDGVRTLLLAAWEWDVPGPGLFGLYGVVMLLGAVAMGGLGWRSRGISRVLAWGSAVAALAVVAIQTATPLPPPGSQSSDTFDAYVLAARAAGSVAWLIAAAWFALAPAQLARDP